MAAEKGRMDGLTAEERRSLREDVLAASEGDLVAVEYDSNRSPDDQRAIGRVVAHRATDVLAQIRTDDLAGDAVIHETSVENMRYGGFAVRSTGNPWTNRNVRVGYLVAFEEVDE